MGRKYEVHIGGRPVRLAGRAVRPDKLEGWLQLRVDDDGELPAVLERFATTTGVRGLLLFHTDVDALWERFRAGYTFVQAAGGAVTDEQGRLLAIRRLGVWDLPKGKLDPGENVESAALREVREECGLQHVDLGALLCSTWHTYERKGKSYLKCTDWFLMRASSEETLVPQAAEDIEEVRWMGRKDLALMRQDTYGSLLSVLDAWEQARRSRP